MYLKDALNKQNNNLDLLRVVAATMVLFAHHYTLLQFGRDPLSSFLMSFTGGHYMGLGRLAVGVFFFISGMLVHSSLVFRQSVIGFVIARSFRIVPALFCVVTITAFVIGPLVTTLSASEYFNHPHTLTYVINNVRMNTQFILPGVFIDNVYPNGVNGSLWTLRYEVICYALLLVAFLVSKLKIPFNFTLWLLFIVYFVFREEFYFILPNTENINMLLPSFMLGVFFSCYKDKLVIDYKIMIISWLVFSVCYFIGAIIPFIIMFYTSVYYSSLVIFTSKPILKLKLKHDISYGVYIWGFIIQQLMSKYFLDLGLVSTFILTLIVVFSLGFVSFIAVEMPCIKLGRRITKKLA